MEKLLPAIFILGGIFILLGIIIWQVAAQNSAHKLEHDSLAEGIREVDSKVKEVQTLRDVQAERYKETTQRQEESSKIATDAIKTISQNTTKLTELLVAFIADHERKDKELIEEVQRIGERLPTTLTSAQPTYQQPYQQPYPQAPGQVYSQGPQQPITAPQPVTYGRPVV